MHSVLWIARQTSWTDQFFIFKALAISHIWRLTFQFVHCRSFWVRQKPCFLNTSYFFIQTTFWTQIFKINFVSKNILRNMSFSNKGKGFNPRLIGALINFREISFSMQKAFSMPSSFRESRTPQLKQGLRRTRKLRQWTSWKVNLRICKLVRICELVRLADPSSGSV